jgi:hypothetical protein
MKRLNREARSVEGEVMGPTLKRATNACLIAALAAGFLASVAPAASGVGPPNGVYTCPWIATHPSEALAARVTCDATMFALVTAPSPVARLTADVPETSTSAGMTPDSLGCTYVPNSGNIGQGVFGWTGYEYSNHWEFTPTYSPDTYTYYIQTSGGNPYTSGNEYDPYTHTVNVPANIYRWGVQNHSTQVNNWYVCYSG